MTQTDQTPALTEAEIDEIRRVLVPAALKHVAGLENVARVWDNFARLVEQARLAVPAPTDQRVREQVARIIRENVSQTCGRNCSAELTQADEDANIENAVSDILALSSSVAITEGIDWAADEAELEGPFEMHSPSEGEPGYRPPAAEMGDQGSARVPVEPTEAMVSAAFYAQQTAPSAVIRAIWAAMLAAHKGKPA